MKATTVWPGEEYDAVSRGLCASAELARRFVPVETDHGLSPLDQSMVGAAAKAVTKLSLYPLDTWKAWRQSSRSLSTDGLRTIVGIYRGVLPKIALYTPYQAVYMAVYTWSRDRLVAEGSILGNSGAAFVVAGCSAEMAGASIRLPMEVSKLRLQLGIYRNTVHAAQELLRHPWGFYGNFVPQTLLHDCVYSAGIWLLFESSRQWVFASRGTDNLPVHENLVLGTATGAICAWITTPLDVLKTRVVGRSAAPGALGVWATALRMWRSEGPLVFWRGSCLRVLHLAPSQGLYMLLYEAAKSQLAIRRASSPAT